jgi:Recombination endonuclease VII
MSKTKKMHLFNTADVKAYRKLMHGAQNGNCGLTGMELPANEAVLDHDHNTQIVRAVLHRQVNVLLGKIENAHTRYIKWWCKIPLPRLLRLMATYLERDYSENPYHPAWIKRVKIDFGKLDGARQKKVLEAFGVKDLGTNAAHRKAAFEKFVKTGVVSFGELQEEIENS